MKRLLVVPSVFRVLLFVIPATAAFAAVVALSHSSEAGEIVVRISELNCDTNPETLTVANQGTTEVSMTGWNLQSDPTTQESLPLASFGVLAPGESLMVQAGPAASGPFVWSPTFLFRDGDPTDFARLASDDGLTVLARVECPASQATTAATPAQTVAPAQTAAPIQTSAPGVNPTVASAAAAPVGGGPPGAVAGSIMPVLMMLFGSGLLSAGLATLAFPLLRERPGSDVLDPQAAVATMEFPEVTMAGPGSSAREYGGNSASLRTTRARPLASRYDAVKEPDRADDSMRMFLAVVVVILAGVAMLAYLLQGGENKRG